jgi:hypothetical protein
MTRCECKVKLCGICGKCSRCECNHDGKEVQYKLSRKRGQHGFDAAEASSSKRVRDKRYENTRLSTSIPTLRRLSLPPKSVTNEEKETVRITRLVSVSNATELFQALGIQASMSVRKHLPSAEIRCDADKWRDSSKDFYQMKRQVFQLYKEVLNRVAALICGSEAAELSINQALAHFCNSSTSLDPSSLIDSCIQSLNNSPKNATESRVARAVLCASHTRKALGKVISSSGKFTMANHTFTRGKADLSRLVNGQKLLQSNRSIQRFNPHAVDLGISYILCPLNVSYTS